MRIAVIGAGGVGGGFGAALANAGGDVTFVARGAHLAAMRENGLLVEGDQLVGTLSVPTRGAAEIPDFWVLHLIAAVKAALENGDHWPRS